MLYTRKGDTGTTKTFGCDQRVSKSSTVSEALGTLDEINSFLGICKTASAENNFSFENEAVSKIIDTVQQTLFSIQAELAGADKHVGEEKIKWVEGIIDGIEKKLPPIKSFFVSGGTKLAAQFDFARTLARRAERRVVGVSEEGKITIGPHTLPFLNRLSSLLYALARFANHSANITEEKPNYK